MSSCHFSIARSIANARTWSFKYEQELNDDSFSISDSFSRISKFERGQLAEFFVNMKDRGRGFSVNLSRTSDGTWTTDPHLKTQVSQSMQNQIALAQTTEQTIKMRPSELGEGTLLIMFDGFSLNNYPLFTPMGMAPAALGP